MRYQKIMFTTCGIILIIFQGGHVPGELSLSQCHIDYAFCPFKYPVLRAVVDAEKEEEGAICRKSSVSVDIDTMQIFVLKCSKLFFERREKLSLAVGERKVRCLFMLDLINGQQKNALMIGTKFDRKKTY